MSESLLTVLTVAEILALVIVLAIYLLIVGRQLRSISATLAEVAWGARAVERQLRAVRSNIGQVNAALADIGAVAPGIVRLAEKFVTQGGRR
ncbi:MAG TPA: hypothetical protein VL120_05805 [Solirubrobacteraceae bacterium]|jgi:uncharacterized protein YoxC|nr:hypothetical protein [Solirubrobacteraceae bacterium]